MKYVEEMTTDSKLLPTLRAVYVTSGDILYLEPGLLCFERTTSAGDSIYDRVASCYFQNYKTTPTALLRIPRCIISP